MIEKKTKLLLGNINTYELGAKQGLCQTYDPNEQAEAGNKNRKRQTIDDLINNTKNADSQILETAFKELAKGCSFTKEERALLEKLDDIITGASIIVNKDGSTATIAQGGTSFAVNMYPESKKSEPVKENKYRIHPSEVEARLVDEKGNTHAQILGKAYDLYSKDGLTANEKELLEKLDKELGDADIQIGECAGNVSIIQSDGKSYNKKVSPCIK